MIEDYKDGILVSTCASLYVLTLLTELSPCVEYSQVVTDIWEIGFVSSKYEVMDLDRCKYKYKSKDFQSRNTFAEYIIKFNN